MVDGMIRWSARNMTSVGSKSEIWWTEGCSVDLIEITEPRVLWSWCPLGVPYREVRPFHLVEQARHALWIPDKVQQQGASLPSWRPLHEYKGGGGVSRRMLTKTESWLSRNGIQAILRRGRSIWKICMLNLSLNLTCKKKLLSTWND